MDTFVNFLVICFLIGFLCELGRRYMKVESSVVDSSEEQERIYAAIESICEIAARNNIAISVKYGVSYPPHYGEPEPIHVISVVNLKDQYSKGK